MAFHSDTADQLHYLETFTPKPSHSSICNLAMCEPFTLKLKENYIVKCDDVHITCFFLIGIVASSNLFEASNAHSVKI